MNERSDSEVVSVGIRPESSILTVLSSLNYSPWYAIAEFIDNAIQSYLSHKNELKKVEGRNFKLRIEINFDKEKELIEIIDNAAGIYTNDYKRAFRPASLPDSTKGLSEFGMGMKSAACWFTWTWSVRSKALGESVERQVWFDVKKIASEKLDELPVIANPCKSELHYTIIRLENLGKKFPVTKTYTKIRNHLASIYREYIRSSEVEIFFDGDENPLKYEDPAILNYPRAYGDSDEVVFWRKDIDIKLSNNRTIRGFAAIRREGSFSLAGFSLFRRNRLIEGSDDDTYKPAEIFGKPNSFASLRLFGELHLSGFAVSHTKDGFNWEDSESEFIDALKFALKEGPNDFLKQVTLYRQKKAKEELEGPITKQVKDIFEALNRPDAKKMLKANPTTNLGDTHRIPSKPSAVTQSNFSQQKHRLEVDNEVWLIVVNTDYDPTANEWIESKSIEVDGENEVDCALEITVHTGHPAVQNFLGSKYENLGFIIRLVISIGLAREKSSRLGYNLGPFMYWINRIMREAVIDD